MPRVEKLGSEEEAESQLRDAIASEEVQGFVSEGYTLSVTIAEIDDITPLESHRDVVISAHATVSDLWQHETMVTLCQLCSGTWRGRGRAIYCWKYGDNKVMALDFSDDESQLGQWAERFIVRRTVEGTLHAEMVGTPTVSVGTAKSTEVSVEDMMSKAQARVRLAKEQGKNQSVRYG